MTHDDSHVFEMPPVCTLTVTLRATRGTLGRIAAALSYIHVRALTYTARDTARATAEIVVSPTDAARAYARLNRMVDVLNISAS